MTGTLLDTSAYSALMRGHTAVVRALREADEIYVSVIVLGELHAGFSKGSKAKRNLDLLREFLSVPRVHVLGVDEETAERYGVVHSELRRRGTPISVNDVWIAATAFQHGLRLLTTDTDFRRVPQLLLDLVEV
jgi:tRNA(fMet)-specific endonuclease VapC